MSDDHCYDCQHYAHGNVPESQCDVHGQKVLGRCSQCDDFKRYPRFKTDQPYDPNRTMKMPQQTKVTANSADPFARPVDTSERQAEIAAWFKAVQAASGGRIFRSVRVCEDGRYIVSINFNDPPTEPVIKEPAMSNPRPTCKSLDAKIDENAMIAIEMASEVQRELKNTVATVNLLNLKFKQSQCAHEWHKGSVSMLDRDGSRILVSRVCKHCGLLENEVLANSFWGRRAAKKSMRGQ